MKPVVKEVVNGDGSHHGWVFRCPGCEEPHVFDSRWTFNGDVYKPTFRASLLVRAGKNGPTAICHSFVTDGSIQFLNDCTHKLKGQTVPLGPMIWAGEEGQDEVE